MPSRLHLNWFCSICQKLQLIQSECTERNQAAVKFDCVVYQLNCEGECGEKSNLPLAATHALQKQDVFLGARKSEWAPVAGSTPERPLGSPSSSSAGLTSGASRSGFSTDIMHHEAKFTELWELPPCWVSRHCSVHGMNPHFLWNLFTFSHVLSFGAPQCASDGVRQKLHHQSRVAPARQLCQRLAIIFYVYIWISTGFWILTGRNCQ
jgi:hypothetical protein